MIIIGIDPGIRGGMAVLSGHEPAKVYAFQHGTDLDMATNLHYSTVRVAGHRDNMHAFIENVHSMPKQGVSSTFKFGTNYGFWLGLLTGFRIPFEKVTPRKWQQTLGCLSKGDKNVTKAKAQQLFPNLKITHATADALLIAEYGRRELNIRNSMPNRVT